MVVLTHRCLDYSSIFEDSDRGLAHVRLSILSHQPIASDGGPEVLVFNVEIYNDLELLAELAVAHQARVHPDTAVLPVCETHITGRLPLKHRVGLDRPNRASPRSELDKEIVITTCAE